MNLNPSVTPYGWSLYSCSPITVNNPIVNPAPMEKTEETKEDHDKDDDDDDEEDQTEADIVEDIPNASDMATALFRNELSKLVVCLDPLLEKPEYDPVNHRYVASPVPFDHDYVGEWLANHLRSMGYSVEVVVNPNPRPKFVNLEYVHEKYLKVSFAAAKIDPLKNQEPASRVEEPETRRPEARE